MQKRRNFLQSAALVGLTPFALAERKKPRARGKNPPIAKPKRLAKGDLIGLVAPASNTGENERIRFAGDIIRSLGFRVKEGRHLYDRKGYLAGEDRDRAADINSMFADERVDAIFALRGGYGTPRLLPYLDYGLIRRNPKALIGYSDLTALLQAIHLKTGLITFHGPIAAQTFSDYTLAEFKKVLMDPQEKTEIAAPPEFEAKEGTAEWENRLIRIRPGKARGRLMGGNLSLLVKLMGTPYEPDFRDKILFIEEVGEQPYRVDGMLTHLWLSGRLNEVAGIVFGKCTECDAEGINSLTLEEVLHHRFSELGVPAIRGLMIGHIKDQTTIPIGIEAELDVDAGTLTLLEPAVG